MTNNYSIGKLLVRQAPHVRESLHAIAITSDYSLTGSDSRSLLCNHRLLLREIGKKYFHQKENQIIFVKCQDLDTFFFLQEDKLFFLLTGQQTYFIIFPKEQTIFFFIFAVSKLFYLKKAGIPIRKKKIHALNYN